MRALLCSALLAAIASCSAAPPPPPPKPQPPVAPVEEVAAREEPAPPAHPMKVQLYVMSQCPYGIQAERAFADVVKLFGASVDIRVDYIGQIGQDGQLSSMHGDNEVVGDLLQVCVQAYAPEKAFDFVLCQDEDAKTIATSGEACARSIGVDPRTIYHCARSEEGRDLLAASFMRSNERGARGSPTIYLNGEKYEGSRKPGDFSRALCNSAGDDKPSACAHIPVPPPVNVALLGDARCGPDCDPKRLESMIRNKVGNPIFTTLDVSSAEGRKLFDAVKPLQLPAAIFDSTLEADADALVVFSRGLRQAGNYKPFSMGGWNPACADEGGCALDECKVSMQCRAEVPKRLDVFMMSQCPFAVKGVDALKEVFSTFTGKDAIDFHIHYIGDGDESSGLKSMHGQSEVDEDVREACVIAHYPKARKYMDYIWCRNKAIRDTGWESCTGGATGIDAKVIKACANGPEGKKLVKASFDESRSSSMQASPTWLANNKFKFSGIDAETIKQNICAHNKLAGCSKTLTGPPTPFSSTPVAPTCGGSAANDPSCKR